MKICPHCGAENPESAEFCSLCLARFSSTGGSYGQSVPGPSPTQAPGQSGPGMQAQPSPYGQQPPPPPTPAPPQYGDVPPAAGMAPTYDPVPESPSGYVSPGDYHALAREMQQQGAGDGYRDTAFYQAAIQNPGSISASGVQVPTWAQKRSATSIIILVLQYSAIFYLVLFGVRFFLSIFLLGAAFGGSEKAFGFALGMWYLGDALVLILAGYVIASKAMERGHGWMYGMACVAAIIFVWQILIWFIFSLLMTGKVFFPLANVIGILFALLLDLPMGALGGWLADKRNFG